MNFNFSALSRIKENWNYRSEPENIHFLGGVFWRILLLLALLAIIFSVTVGVQVMSAVTQAENVSEPASATPPSLDPAKLQSALDEFSARQAQFQTLSQSPAPQVADPSK